MGRNKAAKQAAAVSKGEVAKIKPKQKTDADKPKDKQEKSDKPEQTKEPEVK